MYLLSIMHQLKFEKNYKKTFFQVLVQVFVSFKSFFNSINKFEFSR